MQRASLPPSSSLGAPGSALRAWVLVFAFSLLLAGEERLVAQCQFPKLTASDGSEGDSFGTGVAIHGDVAVVGAPDDDDSGPASGSAYVFGRNGDTWLEVAKLTASDAAPEDRFGRSVAVSENVVLVAATGEDDGADSSGAVYVFQNTSGAWMEVQRLKASVPQEDASFGFSLALDAVEGVALIGAIFEDDPVPNAGGAYVFRFDGSAWSEEEKLLPGDSTFNHLFGWSTAIKGDAAIAGATFDSDGGFSAGAAYFFRYNGTTWVEEQKILASDAQEGSAFGWAVDIHDDVLLVGANVDDAPLDASGSAYVLRRVGDVWVEEQKLTAGDASAGDTFGASVSIHGQTIVIGATGDDDFGVDSGSAYLFRFDGNEWVEETELAAGDGAEGDSFGWSVATTSDYALVGAINDDDAGCESGSTHVYDLTQSCEFARGDCDVSGTFGIGDPIYLLQALFNGGPQSGCQSACDANDDGVLSLADAIYKLQALFAMGADPPPPFPGCGPDPTLDGLVCSSPCP